MAAVLVGLSLIAGPLSHPASAAPADREDGVLVFARDVFVVVGNALRNPDSTTHPDRPLFTSTAISLGPPDLPSLVTWGDWARASATSTVRTSKSGTDVRLRLSGLIPGGLYSVFWGTLGPDSEHPGCPGVERTLPLDAHKPARGADAPNAFRAGTDGAADYRGQVDRNLMAAQQVFFNVVFHFAGRTAYPFPNIGEQRTQHDEFCRSSFGEDAMRHLVVLQKGWE